jgi:hypothetical protein
LTPAVEFGTTHHIASDFLSIGYPALIGLGYRLAWSYAGITSINWVISLSVVVAAWTFLRQLGTSVPGTLMLTAILSLYPDFLLSYSKVQDTGLTAALIFGFMAIVLMAVRRPAVGSVDIGLASLLALAVLARPNLVLLLPVAWVVMRAARAPHLIPRAFLHAAVMVCLYTLVTTLVHGRPFLPQNGPYNLYAGANPFTASHIDNPEDSLVPAVGAHGIYADVNWSRQPNAPGVNDLRDSQFKPLYIQWTRQYMIGHPGEMVKLSGLKLLNLLRPNLQVHSAHSAGGLVKIAEAFAVPLWIIGIVLLPHPGPRSARLLVLLTVVFYVLPFVLTVSAPRFCVALDFVLWMDLGAMVSLARRRSRARINAKPTIPEILTKYGLAPSQAPSDRGSSYNTSIR